MSRRHAVIMATEDGFVLRDLNSRNGTFVDRDKVKQGEHILKHGDKIRLADSEVSFYFREKGAVRTKRDDAPGPDASSSDGSSELAARMVQRARRLMRQLSEAASAGEERDDDEFPEDGEPGSRLNKQDAELLGLLESRTGTIVSKEDIAKYVWPERPSDSPPDREIANSVARLRSQIEEDPRVPARLITVKGHGYLLV